jgi:hypothetical protein
VIAILVASGCGESGPERYAVSGKVTYQTQSVPTGSVFFVPQRGPASAGPIAADGSYQLEAVAGKHRVGVTAIAAPPPGANEMTYVAPPPLVPPKYARPDSSGLIVEVRPDRENKIDINLQ